MSEEKKLDEKALEEVSGGWSVVEIPKFEANNCVSCGHYFNHTIPVPMEVLIKPSPMPLRKLARKRGAPRRCYVMDLDTIGYYLYMEEQENRSREQRAAQETAEAPQEERSFYFIMNDSTAP